MIQQRHWPRLVALFIVFLLVIGACSSGDTAERERLEDLTFGIESGGDDGEFAPTTTMASAAEAPGEERALTADTDLGSGGIEPVVFQTGDLGRDIIFTADLTVAVTDVASAGEEATRLIQGLGGYLFGQRTTGDPNPVSVLTFKVRPEEFQEALDRLGSIGELRDQNVSADDVTEVIVDVESRINTAEASVERLRTLLEEAVDIKTIVELENELLARETQLETLRGRLRTLEDAVALATIVLTITEAQSRPVVSLGVTAYPGHDDGISCPGSSGLVVEQRDDVTVCFEISNQGDTLLTDFELRDPVLDIEIDDAILLFGDLGKPIEPGESILLAVETTAERSIRTQTTVSATPVDEDGEVLSNRAAANTVTMFVQAVKPEGIPTFLDGVQASWQVLVNFIRVIILFAGAVLPFFWVPLVLWLGWRYLRRRDGESGEAGPETGSAAAATGSEQEEPA